jgi:hypothetical protein
MIHIPRNLPYLREIYDEALVNSYSHYCQIFYKEKGYNRDKTDMSYAELMDKLPEESFKHLTIIHRKIVNEHYDLEHYEFGIGTNNLHLEIRVRPDLAQKIINKFGLK